MKNECKIIQDILPLYEEGMVSEDTAAFVESHLKKCSQCRAEFEKIHASNNAGEISTETVQQIEEAAPLKKVKKKFRKRSIITIILAVMITITLVGIVPNLFHPVVIDYGESEKYSQEDMDAAIDLIKDTISSWEGCKLYSIHYTSDELCYNELHYANMFADEGTTYTDCIVFRVHFRSPIFGGGEWVANYKYNWSWYLARTQNGEWEQLTWGQP